MPDPSTQKTTNKTATKPAPVAEEPAKNPAAIVPAHTSAGAGLMKRTSVTTDQVDIRPDDIVPVEFNRTYYQPREGQNPFLFLPLMKSGDVRKDFKSQFENQDDTPLHMVACEVLRKVLPSDNCLFKAKESVGAERGDVVFMLIPARMAVTIDQGLARRMAVQIQSTKLVQITNRKGKKVMAWDYVGGVVPKFQLVTVVPVEGIIMPTGEELEAEVIEEG